MSDEDARHHSRETIDRQRMDRTVVSVHKRGEEPSDVPFWRSRSPQERIREVERIRAEYHNWPVDADGNRSVPRLQRVLRVRKRK